MTLRHMHIFVSLWKHNCNTTKTAQMLHMTQPAVSQAIRELEAYYGVLLFDRIGRRLQITQAGMQLLEYAVHITNLFNKMETQLRSWDSLGILRVGASITIGSQFLPGYVKAFYHQYPGTTVRVQITSSEELERRILNNDLDFALIEGIAHHPSLRAEEYMEDHLSMICSADSPFTQDQVLSLEEFRQQRFLLREPGSGTREVFDRVVQTAGFSVDPSWEATSTTALVNAVIAGLGIAVLPSRMVMGVVRQGLVKSIRAEGLQFNRRFSILYHKDKLLTQAANNFLALCRNFEDNYPVPQYHILSECGPAFSDFVPDRIL